MCLNCSYMYWSSFTTIAQFRIMESPYFTFHVCVCLLVDQLCLTLCDPMDCNSPGSSVHRIFQAIILSGFPCPPPWDFPNPGTEPRSPTLQADSWPAEPQGSPPTHYICIQCHLVPLSKWSTNSFFYITSSWPSCLILDTSRHRKVTIASENYHYYHYKEFLPVAWT